MNATYQKQKYGSKNEKYEIRAAFGDWNNYNLKCPFCFTQNANQNNVSSGSISNINFNNVTYVRFTGGEPFVNSQQIRDIISDINQVYKTYPSIYYVIQTNGLLINRNILQILLQGLSQIKSKIIIEFSFKGTNEEEYRYLTSQNPISIQAASSLMKNQVDNYKLIENFIQNISNIALLPRLGIFHSGIKQSTYRFVYPNNSNNIGLMFRSQNWGCEIRQVFNEYIKNSKLKKIPVEPIKTRASGNSQMGIKYAQILNNLRGRQLIMYNSKNIKQNLSENKYLYTRDASYIYINC